MIVCPRCSKENQDHYKFCLGCGAELPRDQAQPKSFTAPTPPAGVAPVEAPPAVAPAAAAPEPASAPVAAAPAPAAAPGPVSCPNCGSDVPPNFKFCGSCGHDMAAVAAPEVAAPAEPAPAPAADAPAGAGQLVLIRPDGSEGDSFPMSATTVVGREAQGPFASDSYLSPQHAEFSLSAGSALVKDLGSLNGVYVRVAPDTPTELKDGSVFRIGQEILRFEAYNDAAPDADGTAKMGSKNPGYVGRICLVIGRDTYGNCYPVGPDGMHLGRERGDVIFPEDGYVSGLHCRIHGEGGKVTLTDVGSSNGTFIRVDGEQSIPSGTLLLMGQQLFRLEC